MVAMKEVDYPDPPPPWYGFAFKRHIVGPIAKCPDPNLTVRPKVCGVCGSSDIRVKYDVTALVPSPGADERRELASSYTVFCGKCGAHAWLDDSKAGEPTIGWTGRLSAWSAQA